MENTNSETVPLPPVVIQPEHLSADALAGVIDNFIFREGTDYGAIELTHEAKVERVRKQISRGDVLITYDPNTETVSLIPKDKKPY